MRPHAQTRGMISPVAIDRRPGCHPSVDQPRCLHDPVVFMEALPEPDPEDIYNNFRVKFLNANVRANLELLDLLGAFHKTVVGQLVGAGVLDGTVLDTATTRALLIPVIDDLRRNLEGFIQRQVLTVADLTILREQELLKPLLAEFGDDVTKAVLGAIPRQLIGDGVADLLFQGTLGVNINLSETLWVVGEYTQDQVVAVVSNGLANGKHATEIAKDLEEVLVPRAKARDVTWSRANAPKRLRDVIGRAPAGLRTRKGTVSYNYLRIARFEMFRAQRAAHIVNVLGLQRMMPFQVVQGMRWNLSNAHAVQDICDEWASNDDHNLGPGIYPPDAVPLGHPQDMCFTSSELISVREFQRQFRLHEEFFAQPLEGAWAQGFGGVLANAGPDIIGFNTQRLAA